MGTCLLGVKLSTLDTGIFTKLLNLYENKHKNQACPLLHLWLNARIKQVNFALVRTISMI